MTKELDIVLFGATGFTGRLVAEYLVARRPGVRWALAGRRRRRLELVRSGLAALDPAAEALPILVGDSLDRGAMDDIVRRARVVCSTAGPYAKYGDQVVAACVEAGTSYCDITGETHWIRRMIEAHHARAEATGARIVHCCGFDSIPSDLGVLMLHEHLAAQGDRLAEAHGRVILKMPGGLSGGSVATLMSIFENIGDPAVWRALIDPYALDPEGSPRGPDRRDFKAPGRDAGSGGWTAPFIMAAINTRVVRRSNALLGHAYGRDFRYDEAISTGEGVAGLARAAGISAALGGASALAVVPPGRRLLGRLLPAPGEGPSREQREQGRFRLEIHARSAAGKKLTGVVAGSHDPGYGGTAIMLGEAALSLAQDDLPAHGGVLTPAVAMGTKLIERLRAAGETYRAE
ncbi:MULTISPECIES: trans-acting enoyl reductase family protein [Sorangium]|uniref:Saccharopine dehydrogenase n=1 Tax=Sorangium cellulosum TaxID=56 RepID=A0A4P2QJY6_SORCE|nr:MULTISPECIES: saccharopine dehydrogenase NADP-binding domain-containing protein [Sorangium]AUX29971.1 saccharopine dehydrogenase [Sorangium cellulosum]WCQ89360.1 Putative trans-acting enoyl reductase [Sorangium sp. Soce836]